MSGTFSAADYADDDEIEDILRFTARVAQFASPESSKTTRNNETEQGPQHDNGSQGSPVPPGKRINYHTDAFDWDRALLAKSNAMFNVPDFRLCQRGVCNANMDGRDVICVMPTGGGKSLTYQLPALLTPGITVVISPFIDRIEDRVMSLRSCNVEAVMLLGTTEDEEKIRINERLLSRGHAAGDSEIKLCYVTPLMIAKDNEFLTVLYDLHSKGKLTRIVLDKADCVSSYSPNFCSDYGKLRGLKSSLPGVPIMALSAMCLPKVLKDIINVLQLPPIVQGEDANTNGTVYFTVDGAQPWEAGPSAVESEEEDIDKGGSSDTIEDVDMEVGATGYDEDFERFLAEPRAPPQLTSSCEEDDMDEGVSERYVRERRRREGDGGHWISDR